jgi:hypothetical protein
MNNIDTWIAKKWDAPVDIYHPLSRKIKTDIYALDRHQQLGRRENQETTSSMEIC